MLNITMLPALEGDCLLVEYGNGTQSYYMVIDGGRKGTYDSLKAGLKIEKPIELLVVTHVDADHIEGVVRLLYVQSRDNIHPINHVWFNGHAHLSPDRLGAVQGEYVSALIGKCEIPWNAAFNAHAVKVPDKGSLPSVIFPGNMRLTLLAPNQAKLSKFLPKWEEEVHEAGLDVEDPEKVLERLEEDKRLIPDRLGAMAVDMERLLKARFDPDAAPANGSSIAFLAERLDGTGAATESCLFLADAHPDLLVTSIGRLLEERSSAGTPLRKLSVDAVKIPHHGSKNNLSPELVKLLDCDKYLISTNGNTFRHPDQESIARIVEYSGKKPTKLYFNYRSEYNAVWDDRVFKKEKKYVTHYPEKNEKGLTVSLGG
jgi:hypothetical protein